MFQYIPKTASTLFLKYFNCKKCFVVSKVLMYFPQGHSFHPNATDVAQILYQAIDTDSTVLSFYDMNGVLRNHHTEKMWREHMRVTRD